MNENRIFRSRSFLPLISQCSVDPQRTHIKPFVDVFMISCIMQLTFSV